MRITSKGQVTIPQHIREELGLHPNTEVEFKIERGRATLIPKKGAPTIGSKQLMALLRDEPDEIDAD